MLNHAKKKNLLFWSIEILVIVGIIYILHQISFIFSPVSIFISSVFIPILIAGILYYLLNPIVKFLMQIRIFHHNIPRTFAVVIIFVCALCLLYYLISSFVPDIIRQISNLISNMPHLTRAMTKTVNHLSKHGMLKNLPVKQYIIKIQKYVTNNAKGILGNLSSSLNGVISLATNFIIDLITIPIVLFYMLKDGYKLKASIAKFIPKKRRKLCINLLGRMSNTISQYIGGQLIECLFVGFFTAIGFLIIHQPYAILLGAFGGMCVIMPYVGPYIGITPALIIAMTVNIKQAIFVIIVVIIVGQIDGNLIYPNVIGKSLQIHPLTIIIILLAAGHIAGLFGMILAIPLYAILKTVVDYTHSIVIHSNN